MIQADSEPVLVGLSPKVEVIAASTERMNLARAQQCPSVALNTDPDRRPEDDVVMSLFIHLDPELDETSRKVAVEAVTTQSRRVRWKSNEVIVETSPVIAAGLRRIPGVAYIETGLSLSAPNPTDSHPDQEPDSRLRRISTCEELHKYGADVLVGIIDVGGFDFAHDDFLDNGHTRFEAIWDQGGDTRPPPSESGRRELAGFDYGSLIRKHHMDAAIDAAEARKMAPTRLEPQSQMVPGSHGTHVASIAAGNHGVASRARVAGVLIDLDEESDSAATSFYDSTRVTDAIDYLLDLATELGEGGVGPLCVSINISLGTNGHAHDASSLTAQWIDRVLTTRGRCISVASGNSGQTEPEKPDDRNFIRGRIHASGSLPATGLRKDLVWIVEGNDAFSDVSENEMEIWYGAQDRFEVSVKPPGGTWDQSIKPTQKALHQVLDNGTVVNIVSETSYPNNGLNRISIMLSPPPTNGSGGAPRRIAPGEWTVRLTGMVVRDGTFDAWIERDDPPSAPRQLKRVGLPVLLRRGVLRCRRNDQFPGLPRPGNRRGQHRCSARCGQHHVEPRSYSRQAMQTRYRC